MIMNSKNIDDLMSDFFNLSEAEDDEPERNSSESNEEMNDDSQSQTDNSSNQEDDSEDDIGYEDDRNEPSEQNNEEETNENPSEYGGENEGQDENELPKANFEAEGNLNLQKYHLYKNYIKLYDTTVDLLDVLLDANNTQDLNDSEYKTYQVFIENVKDIKGKISFTLEAFENMDYEKLLKIFICLKASLVNVNSLLKKLFGFENN